MNKTLQNIRQGLSDTIQKAKDRIGQSRNGHARVKSVQVGKKKSYNRLEMAAKNSPRANSKSSILKNKNFRKKLKKAGLIALGAVLIISIVGGIYVFALVQEWSRELPDVNDPFRSREIAGIIYDRNGKELYKLYNEFNRDPVKLEEIPPMVRWAFLAAEDGDFYTHQGFDIINITYCTVKNVVSRGIQCGASTITQQMVKITLDKTANTVKRKVQEILMAARVEQAYTKDEILQMYLTVVPFGSNIYGITSAAEFYFGKNVKNLTMAEAAVLASIIQNPVGLSPTIGSNREAARLRLRERQEYVLGQLRDKRQQFNDQHRKNIGDENAIDIITLEMIETAFAEDIAYLPPKFGNKIAGHFVDYVIEQLQKKNYNGEEPFSLSDLQTAGLRIYTTLDYDIQLVSEAAVRDAVNANKGFGMNNAALITTKPSTGEVIAMVGSKDYNGKQEPAGCVGSQCTFDPQVNILTSPQSPGSSTKPHGYYEAYRQGKLYPGSFLPDIPITIPGYSLKNWNGQYLGASPGTYAAEMLASSRNLPAIIVMQLIGTENFVRVMQEFGYTTFADKSRFGPSAILGGSDVIPIEHAQGYSVFANTGDLVKTEVITKIVDRNNNILYEYNQPDRKKVADAAAVYLTNQSLLNNYNLSWDGRNIADKTGTSEDNRDLWLAAYSPDLVSIAWMGNNNNTELSGNAFAANIITPWMRNYLRQIGSSAHFNAKTPFPRPAGVVRGGGCSGECIGENTGLVAHYMIEGQKFNVDNIRSKNVVCKDQPDHLARPIDIALGMSQEGINIRWVMPTADLQAQMDEFVRVKFGVENKLPDEYCTIDRSGGTQGPVFSNDTVITSNGWNINAAGQVFVNGGTLADVSLKIMVDTRADGTDGESLGNFPPNAKDGRFNKTDSAVGKVEPGTYRVTLVATQGGKATYKSAILVVGAETTTRLDVVDADITPPNNYKYGEDIGDGQNITLKVNYTGMGGVASLANVRVFVSKNGGGYVAAGTATINAGVILLPWGATQVDNADATYTFRVEANTGNSGLLKSANGVFTINVKAVP